MKKINLTGTTSENFSIGTGNNLVEFRVIQGRLYFRNVNEPFKELLSNDAEIVLSPLNWSINKNYSEGDLFYYQKSLFKVIKAHYSATSFSTNNNNYRKVSHINADLTRIDTNAYQNNEHIMNLLSSDFVYIYGINQGPFKIKLPEPTSISIGSTYLFQNNSEKIINIYSSNNVFITFINPNEAKQLILIDYNSVDTWSAFSFGLNSINFASIDSSKIDFATGVNYLFNTPSGIFNEDRSGKYNFYDLNDADLNGDIFWVSGGSNYKIISYSTKIASGDVPSKFCYFDNNNILYFKNNTGISRQIVFQNVYKQGI